MEIVACFDRGFVMPTGVMMYSVCKNNADVMINFHLLVDKTVTEEDKNNLLQTVSEFEEKTVCFYLMDKDLYDGLPPVVENINISNATYYRLSVAEILPKTIDKVLYLDGDLIVRQSLLPLWNTDISEFAAAAVYERQYQMSSSDYFDRLGYAPQLGYFNAGVMLINLDFWRKDGVAKQLIDYLNDYPERIKWADQDALNYVLKEDKLELPPKYNFVNAFIYAKSFDKAQSEEAVKSAMENPVIVHFTAEKPWYKYVRDLHPYRNTFFKYQEETRWKSQRVDRRPIKLKLVNAIADIMRFLKLKPKLDPRYVDIPPID